MPTMMFSGSISPNVSNNTYHIVGTISQSGIYVAKFDLGQMRNGDELELRMADSVGAGTTSCIYLASYSHQQSTQNKASPPELIENTGHVSIVQRAGSSRWFYFSLLSI